MKECRICGKKECRICGKKAGNKVLQCPDCGNDFPEIIPSKLKLPKIAIAACLFLFISGFIYFVFYTDKPGTSKNFYKTSKWYASTYVAKPSANPGQKSSAAKRNIKRLRIAAKKGNDSAQYGLARAYANGEGVERNMQESLRWYRLAADQGNIMAQVSLGHIFENGTEVTRNTVEARRWYSRAAASGNHEAQNALKRLEQ